MMLKKGDKYNFEDGNVIEVVELKYREVNGENTQCVTYKIYQGTNLPRQLIMTMKEFLDSFGHLFGIESEHNSRDNP